MPRRLDFRTKSDPVVFLQATRCGAPWGREYHLRVVAPWLVDPSVELPATVGSLAEAKAIAAKVRIDCKGVDDIKVSVHRPAEVR